MNYQQTRDMIEKSSWYQEITGVHFSAAKLVSLSRPRFKKELQDLINRHQRQQVRIDAIKSFCHVPIKARSSAP